MKEIELFTKHLLEKCNYNDFPPMIVVNNKVQYLIHPLLEFFNYNVKTTLRTKLNVF